jgi:hypothetical protein
MSEVSRCCLIAPGRARGPRRVLTERPAGIGEQPHGVQDVVDDHRLAHVELEVAPAAGHGHGGVVPHHLDADHDHGLALGGVDLAGHDARPGSLGAGRARQPGPGTRPEPADVVGDLGERHGQRAQVPLVWTRASWAARARTCWGRRRRAGRSVWAMWAAARSPNSGWVLSPVPTAVPPGPARRDREAGVEAGQVGVELSHVARELLTQGERDGVHEVGPADLHDVGELVDLGRQRLAQRPDRRQQRRAPAARRRRCAWPSGRCRWTTATCSRGRWGGPASSSPSRPRPARWPGWR